MYKICMILLKYFKYLVVFRLDKVKYLRSMGVEIGSGCALLNKVTHYGSEPYLLKIGNKVTICADVFLITHDASSRLFRDNIEGANRTFGNTFGRVTINDNCFIGVKSTLLPGVEIGPNSIVGAGSVVTKSIPPNSVAVGNPAKVIKTLDRFIDEYSANLLPINASDRNSLRNELMTKL
jgi:acetyltransferase-like isoleucine patch superfamily enzyme